MIALGVTAALLVTLFLLWKTRYGYPPMDVPHVLCYHKLSDRFCFEGTWMPRRSFLRQIDGLLARGYEFVGEEDFLEALDHPSPGNHRRILLTFDDGYAELHDMFLRHLLPRGVPVLVFLPGEYIGRKNTWELSLGRRPFTHLSRRQIEEMSDRGARFGSHGARHLDLTRLGGEELDREVEGSKAAIEAITGKTVKSFSYPFGRYNARARSRVMGAGYRAAFSLYPAHGNEKIDRFALRRNGVYIIDTGLAIRCKLRPSPLYWFEEMKCRAINRVAILTPLIRRYFEGRDR